MVLPQLKALLVGLQLHPGLQGWKSVMFMLLSHGCAIILEVDMSSSCLACIDADSIPSASKGKLKGWMMSCSASPGLAEDVQHFFSFQFILERNS